MKDGHPIVLDGSNEISVDAIGANDKIKSLTAESNERRKKLGEANTKLEAFGDMDASTARKAIDDMAGVGDKTKADLEAQRDAINKTWEVKQTEWDTEKSSLNDQLFDATTGTKFATSKVIAGTVLPPDIAKATFGKHFNPDGSANDSAGNPIYSKEKPGEFAEFDEAMTHIIDNYAGKDSIMKATASGGSGGENGGSGGGSDTRTSTEKIAAALKAR